MVSVKTFQLDLLQKLSELIFSIQMSSLLLESEIKVLQPLAKSVLVSRLWAFLLFLFSSTDCRFVENFH